MDRRLLPHQLDDLIVRLCSYRPLGLRALARLLNRSAVYLQNTTLKRLLHTRRLRFQFTDQPNHPHQAYVTFDVRDQQSSVEATEEVELDIGRND